MMEGMLWKWTNYFSGWQPRWFVLDNGILSYYSSQDDISNGCKGSMKISACDVSVHSKDVSRLDLVVPGEAHFYLKAASPQERQQWLIALGTAKACPSTSIPRTPSPLPKEVLPEDELKAKKSELRIYCDLLMQQVHGVKCAINAPDGVNVEQLNESTSLLGATCDTFIQTLDDCVELAHAKFNTALAEDLHFTGSASKLHSRTRRMGSRQRSISPEHSTYLPTLRAPRVRYHSETSELTHSGILRTVPDFTEAHEVLEVNGKTDVNSDPEEFHETSDIALPSNGKVENRVPSFFTSISVSFLDVRLTNDSEIPTIPFLDACRSGLRIFDKLNQTAFAPAKLDIAGNVKKVHHKYLTNPDGFDTLQKIVRYELQCGHSHLASSATLSLLWLNRSLQFINEFLIGFMASVASDHSDDLIPIANTAYSKSLMPYHGWVVRGAFAMAMKSSPSRAELLTSLAADNVSADDPAFEHSVLHDMSEYSSALTALTHMLHGLFENNNLNFADQV